MRGVEPADNMSKERNGEPVSKRLKRNRKVKNGEQDGQIERR